MQQSGSYACGGNYFWVDPFFNATSGVYLNRSSIQLMRKDFFQNPSRWPSDLPLVIAVPPGTEAKKLRVSRGSMKRISCPEVELALFMAIAADIDQNVPDDRLRSRP